MIESCRSTLYKSSRNGTYFCAISNPFLVGVKFHVEQNFSRDDFSIGRADEESACSAACDLSA